MSIAGPLGLTGCGDAPVDPAGCQTPPAPSPGRRRELPRGVDRLPARSPTPRKRWVG